MILRVECNELPLLFDDFCNYLQLQVTFLEKELVTVTVTEKSNDYQEKSNDSTDQVELPNVHNNVPVSQQCSNDGSVSSSTSNTVAKSTLWTNLKRVDELKVSSKDIESYHGIQPTSKQRYQSPWKFTHLKVNVYDCTARLKGIRWWCLLA